VLLVASYTTQGQYIINVSIVQEMLTFTFLVFVMVDFTWSDLQKETVSQTCATM